MPTGSRVLVLHPAFRDLGGAELLLIQHCRFMRQAGLSVRVRSLLWCPEQWAPRFGAIAVDGLDVQTAGRCYPNPSSVRSRFLRYVEQGLQKPQDLVIAHNYPCSAMLSRLPFEGPKLWYCHEPPRWLHLSHTSPYLNQAARREPLSGRWAIRWYVRELLSHHTVSKRAVQERYDLKTCQGITETWANSEFTRQNVIRLYGQHPVQVLYPMVSFPQVQRSRYGLDRTGLRVLSITRMHELKNLDTLLDGFALFVRRSCPSATLDLVGVGSLLPRVRQRIEELSLQKSVRVHGFLPNDAVEQLALQCDVFAAVPLDEPFGMTFPEAAAMGLLLLGPDHGGPFETMEQGRLGRTVEALSVESMAEGFAHYWSMSDAEAERLRHEANQSCRARFSPQAIGSRMMTLLGRHGIRPEAAAELSL